MKTYVCEKRVSKDDKLYQVGEEIRLTDEQAKTLPVTLKKTPKAKAIGEIRSKDGTNNNGAS